VRRGPGFGFSGWTSPAPAFSSAGAEPGRQSGSAVTWPKDPGVGKRDLIRSCQGKQPTDWGSTMPLKQWVYVGCMLGFGGSGELKRTSGSFGNEKHMRRGTHEPFTFSSCSQGLLGGDNQALGMLTHEHGTRRADESTQCDSVARA